MGFAPLKLSEVQVHAVRNSDGVRADSVSSILSSPVPPDSATYIAAAHNIFQSAFFVALQALLRDRATGRGYVQQVLCSALPDAQAVYAELTR